MFHSILLLLSAHERRPVELARLTIEQRVIIRVPMARVPVTRGSPLAARSRSSQPVEWNEKKGPKCVAIRSIRSAAITVPGGVDLILADGHRYRARLERGCRSAGFYSGFYVEPGNDGSLCSGRDELQARGGTVCRIDSFRRLVEAD